MKVTFIYPSMGNRYGRRFVPFSRMEPLMFAVLAGLTPPGVGVTLHDDRFEDIPYDEPTDLVAITVETYTARRAYEIASEYRRRNVPVVVGGCHPTLVPEEALLHSDAVVIGEAEGVWETVLRDAARKNLQRKYLGGRPSLSGLEPRTDIFRGKRYLPVSLVFFGRGCRHACRFCAVGSVYRRQVNCRPVGDVIREIENRGCRTIFFVDDNIASDVSSAKELFRALIGLRVRWVGQISIDLAGDYELVELMAESGCKGVLVGFESLIEENLAQMGKYCNLNVNGYERYLRRLNERGIMLWGSFLLGCDADNAEAIEAAARFAEAHKLALAAFNPLTPYPGTPLYDELSSKGRMLSERWWLDPAFRFGHAVFRPQLMTPEELTEGCMKARLAFNRYRSILRRATDIRANCSGLFNALAYVAGNLIARREVVVKQGLALGLSAGEVKTP
jgi:radical SAM superfamily enzyme YgiQ (UPF0313 family)